MNRFVRWLFCYPSELEIWRKRAYRAEREAKESSDAANRFSKELAETLNERDRLCATVLDRDDVIEKHQQTIDWMNEEIESRGQQIERLKAELDDRNARHNKLVLRVGLLTRKLQEAASESQEAASESGPKRCSPTEIANNGIDSGFPVGATLVGKRE